MGCNSFWSYNTGVDHMMPDRDQALLLLDQHPLRPGSKRSLVSGIIALMQGPCYRCVKFLYDLFERIVDRVWFSRLGRRCVHVLSNIVRTDDMNVWLWLLGCLLWSTNRNREKMW